jgi:small subunit ribosomal protein S3
MGRKVHPIGFRIGTIRDWQAKWYADKHYPEFIQEDVKIRKAIRLKYSEAGVSLVEIERQANRVTITIYTSRPGIVIGRGGQRVDETRHYIEELIGKRVQLNIQEIRQPELDAYLVARMVAEQIGRRIAYRRAMKQAIFRTMQAGAKGMRINCSGRLGGAEIARRQMMHQGRVPLHTLRADIDYGFTEAHTTLGRIGIKVWIYRGDILPEVEEVAVEERPVEPTAEVIAETEPTAAKEKEEKPAKPEAVEKIEAAPVAETEKKAEIEVAEKAEVTPAVEPEKPLKPKAKRVAKKKPAAAKEEEKPAKPKAIKETKAVVAKEPKKPAEQKVKKVTKEKTAATKKTKKKVAKKKSDKTTQAEPAGEIEEKKADATTETGEIPKES